MKTPVLIDSGAAQGAAWHNDEKARQILDGARRVFLRDGFDSASMNDIARVAGVSKGTLYVYFQSKEALFEALVRHDKRQQAEQMCGWDGVSTDVEAVLTRMGRSLLSMMARPDHVAHLRTVMAVAPKFPQIGRAFYEAGPQFGTERLAGYLVRMIEAGVLAVDDPPAAAVQFTQMCMGDIYRRLMFCMETDISKDEIDRSVAGAVTVFLRAYAVARPSAD